MSDHQSGAVAYVIGPYGGALVKIGKADNALVRLAEIQRMSPVALHLLAQYEGGYELETALHKHFKHLRRHGEWFDFGDMDPVAEINAAVEHFKGAAERRKRAAEGAALQEARRTDLSARIRDAAQIIRANAIATEALVLEAHEGGQSLRQIAKDAGMTPEGVRKMLARIAKRNRDGTTTAEN